MFDVLDDRFDQNNVCLFALAVKPWSAANEASNDGKLTWARMRAEHVESGAGGTPSRR